MNLKKNHSETTWKLDEKKVIFHSPFIQLIEKKCHHSKAPQNQHSFYVLESKDWCNIIPVTEDQKVVLIKQYRPGLDESTWEIPGGVIETNENDFLKAAIREMTEETGYTPTNNAQSKFLGSVHPNPAIQNNQAHSFIIGPVKKTSPQNLDPTEIIETKEVPINEIPKWIESKKITHSLMINAFFLLIHKSKKPQNSIIDNLSNYSKTT